jgi:putative oxidoreductase
MKSLFDAIINTTDDYKTLIPRIIVGLIFLSEGIQKFLFPELDGTGRFERIGFSDPSFWASLVGTFEIICGLFVLLGFFTRIASIPLLVIMITAFVTTKWPILINKGFWSMAHEYRTDFALTLLVIYLLIYGAGKLSFDSILFRSSKI